MHRNENYKLWIRNVDLHFLNISVEKRFKMKENNFLFQFLFLLKLLATRKCNLHNVQTIMWFKVNLKKKNN